MVAAFEYDILIGHFCMLEPTTKRPLIIIINMMIQSKEEYGFVDVLDMLDHTSTDVEEFDKIMNKILAYATGDQVNIQECIEDMNYVNDTLRRFFNE
jgi:hypothetical protein